MIAFFPERRDEIVDACRRNIRELVRRSLATGAEVVLLTIFPRGPLSIERSLFWSDAVDSAVIEINRELLDMKAPRLTLFDASILYDEHGYVDEKYAQDLLHLNTAGYDRLNIGLAAILRSKDFIRAGR